jgi:hypothetical protein
MELLIIGIVLIVLFSFFSSGSPKKKGSGSIKISDYVPYGKDDDGNWCTYDAAMYCIEEFSRALGVHEEAQKLYKSEFSRIVSEAKRALNNELAENDENLKGHIEHYESQLIGIDDSEEIAYINTEIKEMKRAHKKVKNWAEKNLYKFENDCRQPLRKTLSAAKTAWNDDPSCFHHLEIVFDPPELPDSYYY